MLITERMKGLVRFGDMKDFVAVFECENEKGQALLRSMEPPRHDTFEFDRLEPSQRSKGRQALAQVSKWIREMLKRHAKDPVSDETSLDEMADFFADEENEGNEQQTEENPTGNIKIRLRRLKPKAARRLSGSGISLNEDEGEQLEADGIGSGSGDGEEGEGTKGSNTSTGGNAQGSDGGASSQSISEKDGVALGDVRSVILEKNKRRIFFTPPTTGLYKLQVEDSGADTNYPLSVTTSSSGEVENGILTRLPVIGGRRCEVEIELDEEFQGTMRIIANAI
jgi:hypothetical protein